MHCTAFLHVLQHAIIITILLHKFNSGMLLIKIWLTFHAVQLLTPSNLTCTRLEGMELCTGADEVMAGKTDPMRGNPVGAGSPMQIRAEGDSTG